MTIERAEQLKKELTDKWVVVNSGVPELRRFEELTGRVKTVNMNCRALVEFDGPEDISWYDIDPSALTVVDAPRPKEKPTSAPPKKAVPAAKAAPKVTGAGSPLDKIRAQGGGAKPAAGSPLDKIRAQSSGGSKPAAAKPAGGSPLDKIRAQSSGPAKPAPAGSPLDQIRAQAAGGSTAAREATGAESTSAPETVSAAASVEETPPPAPPDTASVDTAGMSPLDIIRAQGAFRGDR